MSLLERISDRAPRTQKRMAVRRFFFPSSDAQLQQMNPDIPRDDKETDETLALRARRYDWFEGVTLAAIVLNSIILALEDPMNPGSDVNIAANVIDAILTFFFVMEACVRVTSFGSVLFSADRFFILDSLVVVGSLAALITSFFLADSAISFSGLRTFRLLKPIRSLRAIAAARVIIGSMAAAVSGLEHVGLLFFFLLLIFSVGGVSQYNSRLRTRCISEDYEVPAIRNNYFRDVGLAGYTPYGVYEDKFFGTFNPLYQWTATHVRADIPDFCAFSTFLGSPILFDLMADATFFPNFTLPCKVFDPRRVGPINVNGTVPLSPMAELYLKCYNVTEYTTRSQTLTITSATPSFTSQVPSTRSRTQTLTETTPPPTLDEMTGDELFTAFLDSLGTRFAAADFATRPMKPPRWYASSWAVQTCNNVNALVLKGFRCPFGYTCTDVENPFYGIVGFDNLGMAGLTVFVSVSLELWFDVSKLMADAVDTTAQLYFIAIVVVGALFVLNLIVAQMTLAFEAAYREETEALRTEAAAAPIDQGVPEEKNAAVTIFTTTFARANKWIGARMDEDRVGYDANDSDDEEEQIRAKLKKAEEEDRQARITAATALVMDTEVASLPHLAMAGNDAGLSATPARGGNLRAMEEQKRRAEQSAANKANKEPLSVNSVRKKLLAALTSNEGQLVVCGLIFLTLIQMSLEHHGMSEEMQRVMFIITLLFNSIFTVEVALRWFAFGFFRYFRQVTNLIDLGVVVASWSLVTVPSDSPLQIIRALRLLRFYAVFKAFEGLRHWMVVIRKTLRAAVVLAVVATCAMFVAACLGIQLFGAQFCDLADDDRRPDDTIANCLNRPRANFDSFVNAMITSFQIMTGDDWDLVMYNGIRSQGHVTAFFFVGWFLLSNLVLVNLVIAIVLSARDDVVAEEAERREAIEALRKREQENDPNYYAALEAQERTNRLAREVDDVDEGNTTAQPLDGDEVKEKHGIRLVATTLVEYKSLQNAIMLAIFLSSTLIALESPYAAPDTTTATLLTNSDLAANVFFLLELATKIAAYGFIEGSDSYLRRDGWNIMDFLVITSGFVATIIVSWSPVRMSSTTLRCMGIFRGLRPLRFITSSSNLRLVLGTLAHSVAPLRHLVAIIFAVFTVWGILGVQLFKGKFYSCADATYVTMSNCTAAGHRWQNAPLHFDHLPAAYTTLFSVVTLDRWTRVMWDGVDAVAPEIAFQVNANPAASLYFISFVVVGSFYLLNIFVSVLIEGYKSAKTITRGASPFLTAEQNAWVRSHHCILNLVPQVDYDDRYEGKVVGVNMTLVRVRRKVRKFVRHPLFDVVVYCFIVVNFIIMASDRYPKSDSMALVITVTNTTFTLLFAAELGLRIFADSPQRFFFYAWNRFDFVIVVVSIGSLVLEYLLESTTFASFFRTMRVLRLLRLLRKARHMQIVLKRFVLTLVSLRNIAAVILMLFFSFGIIGVQLFGRVQPNGSLSRKSNFADFSNAVVMLLRMVTAGEWTPIMVRCAATPDDSDCDPHLDSCGINVVSQLYFILFISVASFVVLNLFVAVVLDSFHTNKVLDFAYLPEWEAGQLLQLWLRFDPECTFRMESKYFMSFLRSIPDTCALSMGKLPERRRLQYEIVFLLSLRCEETHGLVELQDVIFALCRRAYAFSDLNGGSVKELPEKRRRQLKAKSDMWFRRKDRDATRPSLGIGAYDVTKRYAVMVIEAYWLYRKDLLRNRAHWSKAVAEREELRIWEAMNSKAHGATDKLQRGVGQGGGVRRRGSSFVRAPAQEMAAHLDDTVSADASQTEPPIGDFGELTESVWLDSAAGSTIMQPPPAGSMEASRDSNGLRADGSSSASLNDSQRQQSAVLVLPEQPRREPTFRVKPDPRARAAESSRLAALLAAAPHPSEANSEHQPTQLTADDYRRLDEARHELHTLDASQQPVTEHDLVRLGAIFRRHEAVKEAAVRRQAAEERARIEAAEAAEAERQAKLSRDIDEMFGRTGDGASHKGADGHSPVKSEQEDDEELMNYL